MTIEKTLFGSIARFAEEKTRTKVYDDTVLVKFPLYCPKCKKEIKIDVIQLKMVLSK